MNSQRLNNINNGSFLNSPNYYLNKANEMIELVNKSKALRLSNRLMKNILESNMKKAVARLEEYKFLYEESKPYIDIEDTYIPTRSVCLSAYNTEAKTDYQIVKDDLYFKS